MAVEGFCKLDHGVVDEESPSMHSVRPSPRGSCRANARLRESARLREGSCNMARYKIFVHAGSFHRKRSPFLPEEGS